MPGTGGLDVVDNLLSNAVQLNLNRNQAALKTSVTRLSSGLRINSAADDPSGLAIAEKLESRVNGFDQGSRNVQDATNAITVADGALQTVTDIVQRIRTLAVEAASDITSTSDKASLQTEVNQLLLEVNRISQNTQFNGTQLLSGLPTVPGANIPVQPLIRQNATSSVSGATSLTLNLPNQPQVGDLLVAGVSYYYPSGAPTPPPGWTLLDDALSANNGYGGSGNGGYATYAHTVTASDTGSYTWNFPGSADWISGSIVEVTNVDPNQPIDAHGAQAQGGPASLATTPSVTASSNNDLAIAFTGIDQPGAPTTPSTTGSNWSELSYQGNTFHQILTQVDTSVPGGVAISAGTLWSGTGASVGGAIVLISPLLASAPPIATNFAVQDAADEGTRMSITLPNIDTATLGISTIDVTSFNGAESAIGSCDVALTAITQSRALLGAQNVSFNEDGDNDNIASVNLQAAESGIRDLNVATETTTFNREQILVSVGTSVLAQANLNPQSVLKLFP